MANNIDERIVEMQFNNKDFEKGVSTTIGSLDKLKKSLDFEGSVKGFEKMDAAARGVDLNPLVNSIEVIKTKFSALEIAAISAFSHIVVQAVDAGEKLVKSFTLDPIMAGFDKYETKVASVQKILNSSWENTMPMVEKALDKIEWFTNETSYQYDQMVSTLGSFAASGIALEDATNMIIGIANAAAISGVNAKDASHAMLGFQRAISAGSLQLGVWNSYMKTAGMQSQVFVEKCIEIGLQVGTLKKSVNELGEEIAVTAAKGTEVSIQTFSETLKQGWLDKEVLTETMKAFSVASDQLYAVKDDYDIIGDAIDDLEDELDAFSLAAFKAGQETKTWGDTVEYVRGTVAQTWSKTWELIFGNYEEATEFFSTIVEDMYDLFIAANVERNKFLKGWKDAGGRNSFMNGLINSLRIVINIVDRVKSYFASLIPPVTVEMLVSLTSKFEQFTIGIAKSLGIADEDIAGLTSAFGLLDKGIEAISGGLNKVEKAAEPVAETIKNIDELAKAVIHGDYGNGATRIEKLGNAFYKVQNRVNELLGCSFRYGKELVDLADQSELLGEATKDLADSTRDVADAEEEAAGPSEEAIRRFINLSDTFKGVVAIIQILGNVASAVYRIGQKILPGVGKIGDAFLGVTGTFGDFLDGLKDFIIEGDIFYKTFESIYDFIVSSFGPSLESLGGFLDDLTNRQADLSGFFSVFDLSNFKIPELPKIFENIGTAIDGLLSSAGTLLSGVKLPELPNMLGKIGDAIGELLSSSNNLFSGFRIGVGRITLLDKVAGLLGVDLSGVGEGLSGMYKTIGLITGGAIGKLTEQFDGLRSVFSVLSEYWDRFMGPELVKSVRNWFIGAEFKDIGPFSIGSLSGQKLFPFVEKYYNANWDFGKGATLVANVMRQLSQDIPILKNFAEVFENFSYFLTFAIDLLRTTFTSLGYVLEKFFAPALDLFDWVVERVKEIDFPALLRLGVLIGVFALLFTIAGFITRVGKAVQSIGWMFESIYSLFKSFIMKNYAGVILEIAVAVGIIGYVVYKLVEVARYEGPFLRAAITVVSILVILAGVAVALGLAGVKISTLKSLEFAGAMLAMAAALGIVVGVLFFLKDLPWSDFWSSCGKALIVIVGLLAVFAAFGAVIALLGKLKVKKLPDWKTMAGFYLFILGISKAVDVMAELAQYPFEEINYGMGMLVITAGILIAMSHMMAKIKFTGSMGLLFMVGALWLFVKFLDGIKDYDTKAMMLALVKLIPVFMVIGILTDAASKAGLGAVGLAAVLLAFMWSVDILSNCVKKLAVAFQGVDFSAAFGAVFVVATSMIGLFFMLDRLVLASNSFVKGGGKELLMAFAGLSIAVLGIALAVKIMSTVDWANGFFAAVELGGMIVAFGYACKLASNIKTKMGPLIVMVTAIVAIAISLSVLASLDVGKVLGAAIGMGIVFGAIALMMTQLKVLSSRNVTAIKVITEIGMMIGLVLLVATALHNLAKNDWQNVVVSAASLSLVIITFGGAMMLMKGIRWKDMIAPAAAMGMVIAGIGVAMLMLVNYDWQSIATAGAALSGVILAMSALFGVFAAFDRVKSLTTLEATASAIFHAFPTIAGIVAEFSVMLFALAGLNTVFKEVFQFDILGMIIDFICQLVEGIGHVVSAFGLGLTAELPKMGENIGKFAEGIKPLVEVFTTNTADWLQVVTNTACFLDAIHNLNKASVTGIDSNLLGKNISDLAVALQTFWQKLSDSNVDVYKAKQAADAIATLTSLEIPTVDGDANSFERLSEGMTGLGNALVAFNNVVSGEESIDFTRISKGFALISQLGSIVSHIDTSKFAGWKELIGVDEEMRLGTMGERSAGTGLQQMAIALKQFDNVLAGDSSGNNVIDIERLENAFDAIKALAGVAKEVPDAGGVIQAFMGQFSWSTLYDGLVGSDTEPGLATALIGLSEKAKAIDLEGLDIGLDAISRLGAVANDLDPAKGGFLQAIVGDDTLAAFATALGSLTPQLTGFIDAMKGYQTDDVWPAFAILRRILNIPMLFKDAGINPSEGGMGTLTSIGYGLETFATSFANMYETFKGLLDPTGENSDISAPIRSLLESLGQFFTDDTIQIIQDVGTKLSKTISDGMHSETAAAYTKTSIFQWATTLLTELTGEGGTNYNRYIIAGHLITELICKAITDAESYGKIRKAGEDLIYEMIVKIRTLYGGPGHGMYGAGQHLVDGLIAGMESKRGDLVAEAQSLADDVNNTMAAPEGFDLGSPSKLWHKYGEYLDAGLANGILDNKDGVVRSAKYLASAVNGEFQSEMSSSRFSPVIDISNARTAAGNLNTMFDSNRAAALSATMELNSQVTQIDQLVDVTNRILGSIQNGSDLYLDERILAGRINRRLGAV